MKLNWLFSNRAVFPTLFLLLFSLLGMGQQVPLSGIVKDGSTKKALVGANVAIPGAIRGVVTDEEGRFRIELTPGESLAITYLGYESQLIEVTPALAGQPLEILLNQTSAILSTSYVYGTNPIEPAIPAPIMTLNAEDLNRDALLTITPALNRVPGVLMQNGTLSTNRITIRGIGNRSPFGTAKIRAYLDDIPLTSGVGETTLEDIDLSLIHKVQVWKGPTGSTYGAGLGGMIHLQTGNELRNSTDQAAISALGGAYGTLRSVANASVGKESIETDRKIRNWRLDANINHTQSDGYRQNNHYNRDGAALLSRLDGQKGNRTTLLATFTKVKAFIPSSLNREDYLTQPEKAAFTWAQVKGFEDYDKTLVGISHRHYLRVVDGTPVLQNTSSLFGTYRQNYESRPFNILTEANTAVGGRSHFEWRLLPKTPDKLTLHFGAEIFTEKYDWQTYETDGGRQDTLLSDQIERRNYHNLFAEARMQITPELKVEAGVNYNHTQYNLTDHFLRDNRDLSGDYRFSPVWSPRLGILYGFTPGLSVFGAISHGFSPPTLEETLTPAGTINPDIQPEKGWNFEIGSRGKNLGDKWSYELTLYSMHIKDLLVARRTALDQFVGVNAGKTVHNGIEAFLIYQLWGPIHCFANVTLSDYRFDAFLDGDKDYSGNELTGTPPKQLNAGVDYNLYEDGLYGNINIRYLDAMPLRDDNSVYSEASQVVNVKMGYRKSSPESKKWGCDVYAGINNVLDEKYAAMFQINASGFGGAAPRYYYPGLPRNFFVGVRVDFGL